jgi:hypothetical protein
VVTTRRRRLRDIELTGTSRSLRRGSLIVITALAATNVVLYLPNDIAMPRRGATTRSGRPALADSESYSCQCSTATVLLAAVGSSGISTCPPVAVLAGRTCSWSWLLDRQSPFDTTEGPLITVLRLTTFRARRHGLWLFVLGIVLRPGSLKARREDHVFPSARIVSE